MNATRALTWFSLVIAFVAPLQSASPSLPRAATGRVWVIFIDDLHLDFPATGRLKELYKTISSKLVKDADLVAVASTGPSSLAIDVTRDRQMLSTAHRKISGAALRPSETVAIPDQDLSEVRYRAHVSLETAYGVLKMLAGVPNTRKAFVYISNGYYFDVWPGAPASATSPFSLKEKAISLERLRNEVAELVAQAKRANVTIYGVDPRGLSGPPTIDPNLDDAAWQRYWTTTRNSLQVMAEQTGGFVIQENLENGLKRMVE